MARTPIGYNSLIAEYDLPARELLAPCYIDTAAAQRKEFIQGHQTIRLFESIYLKGQEKTTLATNLEFALRYEVLNLEVLSLLFARQGKEEIEAWLTAIPLGQYARKAACLYEFLTERKINAPAVPPKTRYVPLLDPENYITGPEIRNARFGISMNVLGNVNFCPTIRRTTFIRELQDKNLREKTAQTLSKYDKKLLDRAAAFLYLKETHSSFSIEKEKPSTQKAERFAQLLAAASSVTDVTKEELVRLQNAVIDGRFAEPWFRRQQNWVGKEIRHYKKVDFLPPRPEDVESLLDGLLTFANRYGDKDAKLSDDVAIAASVAFGFVFIHPFMDGNGRLHRFLIHQMLSRREFTPKGIILPVSAVMLANLDEYIEALEDFSKALMPLTRYNPDAPEAPATGNDAVYYKYFDATRQTEFLYSALERTVTHDLEAEIKFLIHYDVAYAKLNDEFDWPKGSLSLFIRLLSEQNGRLSTNKRASHFDFLTDAEVVNFQEVFAQAFEVEPG